MRSVRPLAAGYVMLGPLISRFAVWRAPETFRRDLRTTGAAIR
jgi:MHS family shikimate/dehydroshikimate transporter-like MFS transporter